MDRALIQSYLDTTYVAYLPGGDVRVRIGEPVTDERVRNLDTWGFVTGWNPASVPQPDDVNTLANAKLADELDQLQLKWVPGDGEIENSPWPGERGFFVMNISREALLQLCNRYEQNAVVFGRRDTAVILFRDGQEIRSLEEFSA